MTATALVQGAEPRGRPKRFTVTQWFGLVVGVLLIIAALGLLAGLLALGRLTDRRELLADRLDPANTAALRLSSALLNEETGVRGYVLARDRAFLEPYRRGRAEERAALRDLAARQTAGELGTLRADLLEVHRRAAAWRSDYAEPAIAAAAAGADPPPVALGKQRFDAVRAAVTRQQRDLQVLRDDARSQLDRTATFVTLMFVGAGLLVLLAVLAAALTLRRAIITPIERLARDVREIAHGDFEHPLDPSGPREVAELGSDIDAMRRRIVAEVTALRHAETALLEQARELQRSNEELEQFAYVASHDLQEPLRKVASFTQMLERRYKGQLDERADRYIAFAVDGAKRMQELINDLLEFSRVGRLTRAHEPVDCNALVEQACARLATMIAESGADVSAGELPTVNGDHGLLIAVFQNLIANAVKFRDQAPPKVRIEAKRDGRFWRLSCTDNGIGVEDEYAERIFVIFQRLHTREAYEGTGIGLAMCRKIVEYHGGHIYLDRAEAGRGARFIFTLPADVPQEETST
jgi:signal transduction histidine kinase